jgi:hypothetical protein
VPAAQLLALSVVALAFLIFHSLQALQHQAAIVGLIHPW